jgi:hypothetical protein
MKKAANNGFALRTIQRGEIPRGWRYSSHKVRRIVNLRNNTKLHPFALALESRWETSRLDDETICASYLFTAWPRSGPFLASVTGDHGDANSRRPDVYGHAGQTGVRMEKIPKDMYPPLLSDPPSVSTYKR